MADGSGAAETPAGPELLKAENLHGMAWMVLSGGLFALNFSIVRHLGQDLSPYEIIFWRNLFGFVALIPLLMRTSRVALVPTRPLMLLLRAVMQTVGLGAWYTAIILVPLATAVSISMLEPILTSLFAILFMREQGTKQRWAAAIVGFVGTLVIIRPGFQEVSFGLLLPLFSAAMWASYLLLGKVLTRTESVTVVVAYPTVLVVPMMAIPAYFTWHPPTLEQYGWFVVSGVLTSMGTFTITKAFQVGDASAVAPMAFLRLLFSALAGYVFFSEVPEIWVWIGGAVIVAAATYLARQEARERRRAEAPLAPST